MRTIMDALRAAQKLNIREEVENTMIDTAENYTGLQKDQLSEGLRSDDKPIFNILTGRDSYSPGYAKKKGRSRPIDLKNTGAFYSEIFLDVRADDFLVDSADSKTESLIQRYGDKIFGLGKKYQPEYNEMAQPVLISRIEKVLSK